MKSSLKTFILLVILFLTGVLSVYGYSYFTNKGNSINQKTNNIIYPTPTPLLPVQTTEETILGKIVEGRSTELVDKNLCEEEYYVQKGQDVIWLVKNQTSPEQRIEFFSPYLGLEVNVSGSYVKLGETCDSPDKKYCTCNDAIVVDKIETL